MAESTITPDLEALLATYKSRVTPLEIPKTTSPSSLPTTKYKSGSNLLTLRATSESPSPRPLKIIHHEFSDAGIIGRVNNVVHGTHNSRRATLVTFSFSFRTGHHALRFKNASIKVVFEKHPSAESHHRDPAIVKFAPRKIFGLPVKETDHRKYSAEFAGSVPVGPVEVGPKAGVEIEREYEKEYRFKTVGNFWSTKHGSEWDVVYWIVQENKRSEQGIPDLLNVAVIVENEGPFQATVEVRVDTPLLKGLFGFPWSKADPVAFIPDVAVGEWKSTLNFEELTERDWRKLIPYEEEFEDKLTEATALYISRENTPVPPGTYGDSLIVTEGDDDEKPVLVEDQPDEGKDDEDEDNPRKRQKR